MSHPLNEMKHECLNCGQKEMVHTVRDVPYTYKGHHTVISKVKGWHCLNCGEVEFKLLDNHPDLLDEITPGSGHP
jgi:YgiT-type zinc finger domain-containing protein